MKKIHAVLGFLIIASMILTACGSGCKAEDTDQQCRERSPIEQPINEADQTTDELIKELNQRIDQNTAALNSAIQKNDVSQGDLIQELNDKIDTDTKLRDAAIQQYAAEQDKEIQKVNVSYTNWATNLAESIFGSP